MITRQAWTKNTSIHHRISRCVYSISTLIVTAGERQSICISMLFTALSVHNGIGDDATRMTPPCPPPQRGQISFLENVPLHQTPRPPASVRVAAADVYWVGLAWVHDGVKQSETTQAFPVMGKKRRMATPRDPQEALCGLSLPQDNSRFSEIYTVL